MNKPTWQELLETGLYATAGAAAEFQDALPRLVEKGRSSLGPKFGLARVIGQLAVGGAENEIRKRSDVVVGQISEIVSALFSSSSPSARKSDEGSVDQHPRHNTESPVGAESTIIGRTASGSPEDLPISGYTTLSAQQVIARLENLSNAELEKIAIYEAAHRNRASIARAIASKRRRVE